MAKKKEEDVVESEVVEVKKVLELVEEFGNGDLNVLKDKINEVIRQINK